jgi:acyl phosphate:glycerol-3-phosphate acyltransferase
MLDILFWTLIGFLLGAVPFSLLMGEWFAKKDIRTVGDGNPGGANAVKAGGLKAGVPAILLDIGKGFLPAYLAQKYGLAGWNLLPVCLAPILGHAFSPFLRFHGGKALGASGGVWLALAGLVVVPVYAILALPFTIFQSEDAWSANVGMLALLIYAIRFSEPWLVTFAILNALLIVWTHRRDLVRPLHLRPWVTHIFVRRQI